MYRETTKAIHIGDAVIGNGNQILIQSMTNTKTEDVKSTVQQIKKLEEVGCHIIRVAVPTKEAALAIKEIKRQISIPIVADIHFDYKLALLSIENGADKIRINPGNIGTRDKLKAVVEACKVRNIPIRVGVNSGSLEKSILEKFGKPTAEALVESAIFNVELIQQFEYDNLVVSIKSSDVLQSIEAYELAAKKMIYPLHIGITEAGTLFSGTIKSSVGLGIILAKGIGDTLRVSLTGDPIEEIRVGQKVLQALDLYPKGVEIISCPTCGRTQIELIKLANEVEKRCEHMNKQIKVAIMGCAVNGPGEAREADIGIAGGQGVGLIFKKGEVFKKVEEGNLIEALIEEINKL
ncbi:MAG: 4-hydroxy-3-methylbut-2-en-1-yl diphosphate synthase [Firmicutes bacterium HGW-Firmicutes-1]|jgi:(E)-4-hydroxy-3-methylbut-2-enyl-diphosphate synthase|nr:MAG: 4-hydroxy-3-methylbut-2-en-1-yl diphosphate synthase [Firmicutes bacterium HGW-Firmicutes-1]